jgi:hypothetical protein
MSGLSGRVDAVEPTSENDMQQQAPALDYCRYHARNRKEMQSSRAEAQSAAVVSVQERVA